MHQETPHLSNPRTLQGSSGASHLLGRQFDDTQWDCEQGCCRNRLRGCNQSCGGMGPSTQRHHTYGLRNDQQYFHPWSRPQDRQDAGPAPDCTKSMLVPDGLLGRRRRAADRQESRRERQGCSRTRRGRRSQHDHELPGPEQRHTLQGGRLSRTRDIRRRSSCSRHRRWPTTRSGTTHLRDVLVDADGSPRQRARA